MIQINDKFEQILDDSADHWSNKESIDQLKEEMGELLVALQQFKRGRVGTEDVLEEMADVTIMIQDLVRRELYGGDRQFNLMLDHKLKKMMDLVHNNMK